MSESSAAAPAAQRQAPPSSPPKQIVVAFNEGVFVGKVVNKGEQRKGKHTNERTGEPFELKEDRFTVQLQKEGGARCTFNVPGDAYATLIGSDVVRITYELGNSGMEGLFRAYVLKVERIKRGDGSLPAQRRAVFVDVSAQQG